MEWDLGIRFCKRASPRQLECAAQDESWPALCIWLASVVWAKPSSGSFQFVRYFGNLHRPPVLPATSSSTAVLPAQHGTEGRRRCHRLHWGCTWLGVLFVLSFLSACCADMSLHECCLVLLFNFFFFLRISRVSSSQSKMCHTSKVSGGKEMCTSNVSLATDLTTL